MWIIALSCFTTGIGVGILIVQHRAISHHAAHYNSTNANFEWNEPKETK
jgi:hypothetical protein